MTRDDLRKLIGGYATGSLTDAERKTLFDAALEDQNIFDELAGEHALKEILDAPGARDRLIGALAPEPRTAWWRRPMAWTVAAAVAAIVIALSWTMQHRTAPLEIARVDSGSPIVAPPVARGPSAPQPVPQRKPRESKTAAENNTPAREFARDRVAAPPEAREESDSKAKLDAAPQKSLDKDEKSAGLAGGARVLDKSAPAAPPAPAAAPPPPAPKQTQQQVEVQASQPAPLVQQTEMNRLQAPSAGAVALRSAPIPRFSFEYSLGAQELVLHFAADGYFSLHFSPGLDTIVQSRVTAGSTRREHIPNNATEAAMVFAAAPQTATGGVSLVREDKSGSVEDPSRTRIELLLRFYP